VGVAGAEVWPKNGQKSKGKSSKSKRSTKEGNSAGCHEEGFGCDFEGLSGPIGTKLGLNFIVDIVSSQLIQKLSNLVTSWLPKSALRLH